MSSTVIDIIIPHYNGKDILTQCLDSLHSENEPLFKIFVVDNGSTDGSREMLSEKYPAVEIIYSDSNLGYAGGCNLGFEYGDSPLVLFYNNDTEIKAGSLKRMSDFLLANKNIAAVQPKIISMRYEGKFDYAGASGGYLDRLAFPWCRGRVLDKIEEDHGQYDDPREVFWTSGAAFMVKRDVLNKIGLFDLTFFAHMEEIDLNWRILNAGYKNYVLPEAVVYHYSGYTLEKGNMKKYFFNHRNNLLMIVKNAPFLRILWLYPLRLVMDILMLINALFSREFEWAKGILFAFLNHFAYLPHVLKERRKLFSLGIKPGFRRDLSFPFSIIYNYFILKRRDYSAILDKRS